MVSVSQERPITRDSTLYSRKEALMKDRRSGGCLGELMFGIGSHGPLCSHVPHIAVNRASSESPNVRCTSAMHLSLSHTPSSSACASAPFARRMYPGLPMTRYYPGTRHTIRRLVSIPRYHHDYAAHATEEIMPVEAGELAFYPDFHHRRVSGLPADRLPSQTRLSLKDC